MKKRIGEIYLSDKKKKYTIVEGDSNLIETSHEINVKSLSALSNNTNDESTDESIIKFDSIYIDVAAYNRVTTNSSYMNSLVKNDGNNNFNYTLRLKTNEIGRLSSLKLILKNYYVDCLRDCIIDLDHSYLDMNCLAEIRNDSTDTSIACSSLFCFDDFNYTSPSTESVEDYFNRVKTFGIACYPIDAQMQRIKNKADVANIVGFNFVSVRKKVLLKRDGFKPTFHLKLDNKNTGKSYYTTINLNIENMNYSGSTTSSDGEIFYILDSSTDNIAMPRLNLGDPSVFQLFTKNS